jgi:hypothetical protein
MNIEPQLSDALSRLEAHIRTDGAQHAADAAEAVADLLIWIQHFRTVAGADSASELLVGARAAAAESVAYTAFGLGRAAIGAIRCQIDLMTAYTYFKDHPVEWRHLAETGEGFMLPSAVERYHRDMDSAFGQRLDWIENSGGARLPKVYRLLSAHIHAQSSYTLPTFSKVSDVVTSDSKYISSIIELQRVTTDALSNYLVALYSARWPELPESIVRSVSANLASKYRAEFFGSRGLSR